MFSEVPQIARNWWMFAVLGVICVATGIAAIVWPDITLLVLGLLFGIYLLMAAIIEIIEAIAGPPGGRAMSGILGVIALIAGLICLRRPGASLLAIVVAVGIYLIAAGVLRLITAFALPQDRGWAIALALLDAAIGIVILAWPNIGLATLAVVFAITMLFKGAFSIVIGLKLRSLRHAGDEPPPVHHATLAT